MASPHKPGCAHPNWAGVPGDAPAPHPSSWEHLSSSLPRKGRLSTFSPPSSSPLELQLPLGWRQGPAAEGRAGGSAHSRPQRRPRNTWESGRCRRILPTKLAAHTVATADPDPWAKPQAKPGVCGGKTGLTCPTAPGPTSFARNLPANPPRRPGPHPAHLPSPHLRPLAPKRAPRQRSPRCSGLKAGVPAGSGEERLLTATSDLWEPGLGARAAGLIRFPGSRARSRALPEPESPRLRRSPPARPGAPAPPPPAMPPQRLLPAWSAARRTL